jgi:hypothetical protein
VGRGLKGRCRGVCTQGQGHAVGAGGADERRTPHDHVGDGAHGIVEGEQAHEREFVRQPRLIDDLDGAAVFHGIDGSIVLAADFHRFIRGTSR